MKLKQVKELKEYMCIYREIDKVYHEMALKAGLSDSAFLILFSILELGEGCLQRDICDMLSISKQTINSSIKKLERDGYIQMKQNTGKDKNLYLTPQGKQLAQDKILPISNIENEIFTELKQEESQELVRLTRHFLEELRDKSKQL